MDGSMERRYLRFAGRLWENGEFVPGVGWETARIARRPRPTPGYRLQLLDGSADVLVDADVELRSGECGVRGTRGMSGGRVTGYLPLHPGGRAIAFRRGERLLYALELAAAPPRVAVTSVNVRADGQVELRWEAAHERPLLFNVVLVDSGRRAIPVARELSASHLVLSTAELPGGPGCSLAVLATDGLRSAMARSEPFDLPDRPPRVTILTPGEDEVLTPDQPISLLGSACDLAGHPLPDERLVWRVDGEVVACGRRLVAGGPLAPGAHEIQLGYGSDGEPLARAVVRLRVSGRSPAQERWLALSSGRPGAPAAREDASAE